MYLFAIFLQKYGIILNKTVLFKILLQCFCELLVLVVTEANTNVNYTGYTGAYCPPNPDNKS